MISFGHIAFNFFRYGWFFILGDADVLLDQLEILSVSDQPILIFIYILEDLLSHIMINTYLQKLIGQVDEVDEFGKSHLALGPMGDLACLVFPL